MLGRTDHRLRLVALLVVLTLFATALGARLSYWQLGEGPHLQRLAAAQLSEPRIEQPQRGRISDRSGALLATTAYRDQLAAHPDLIRVERRADVARDVAALLELGATETAELVAAFESGVPYVVVSRRLTDAQSQQVRAGLATGELAALTLEPSPVRFYPNQGGSPRTTLASKLLGFVSQNGAGQYGVEQYHQDVLAGQPGVTAAADGGPPPLPGADVQLTIDASLQLRLEKELHAAWVANRAAGVSGVVMEPHTGAILAWASVPGYDANAYAATARNEPALFVDPISSQVYEPGSVMKMLTAAAALEQGVVEPDTIIEDSRALRFGSIRVHNSDRRAMGPITFEDVIAYSRNVATGKVARMLGRTTDEAAAVLYEMWQRLGIGQPTGIELSNESAGLVTAPDERPWQPIELANRAFGQGVAITPLQLAVAYSAMANGGRLVSPHVVSAIDGEALPAAEPVQVFEPALAEQLRQLMIHVVTGVNQYADDTLIPGYVVGGKTGTAQIWDAEAGRWAPDVYNHTFAGFAGAEEVEMLIVVRIHEAEPRVHHPWGMGLEMSSNELFRRIAQDALQVFDVPPVATTERTDPTGGETDATGGETDAEDESDSSDEGQPPPAGDGTGSATQGTRARRGTEP